jgi:hypothetical protein
VAKRCYLTFFHFPNVHCTSKMTGSPKELELIRTCPTLTKCYSKVAHAFYIHWWTSFSRTKPGCRCYLTFFHFPERSIALVKTTGSQKELKLIRTCPTLTKVLPKVAHAFYTLILFKLCCHSLPSLPFSRTFNCTSKTTGSPKELKLIRTCPTLTKVLLQYTHSYIHWWTSFSRTKCGKPLLSYLLPFSWTFSCTSKTTGSPKGAELIPTCPTLTKCSKVAHAFLYTLMDSFPHQTVPSRCYLTFFLPNVQLLVKPLVQKELNWSEPAPRSKCYSVARILIYIDGPFSRTKLWSRCYLTFFHFPERSIALVKRLVHQEAEIDPNLPHANKVLPKVAHAFLLTDSLSVAPNWPSRCYLTFFHFPNVQLH